MSSVPVIGMRNSSRRRDNHYPNDPTSHQWYSLLLRTVGRLEKALEEAQLALDVDPASPIVNLNMAHTFTLLGYDEKALRFWQVALDLGFESTSAAGDLVTNMAAIRSGDREQLRAMLREPKGPDGENLMSEDLIEAIIRIRDDPGAWAEVDSLMARDADKIPEEAGFQLNLLAGRPQKALELALKYPDRIELNFLWVPEAAPMRRLPGFADLAEALGLMGYWKQYGWPDDCRPVGDDLQCGFASLVAAR